MNLAEHKIIFGNCTDICNHLMEEDCELSVEAQRREKKEGDRERNIAALGDQ